MLLNITWQHWLVILGTGISLTGASTYIRDTLKGDTKPNKISWGLWAAAPLVAFGASLSSGSDPWPAVRVFLAAFVPLIIFLSSFFNKNSYWKLNRFDIWCGTLSVAALIAWLVFKNTDFAIILALAADMLAGVPTVIKAWKYPETESGLAFVTSAIALLLTLPSIPVWNIGNSAFQIYLLTIDVLISAFIYRKRMFARL